MWDRLASFSPCYETNQVLIQVADLSLLELQGSNELEQINEPSETLFVVSVLE
jgi:hypothetical protein